MFALFTPWTPLPARCRGGTASVVRLAGVAQGREFAQLHTGGKPISNDVESLSAIMIAEHKNRFRKIFAKKRFFDQVLNLLADRSR